MRLLSSPEHLVDDRDPILKKYARTSLSILEHLAGDRVHIPIEFAGIPLKSGIYRHLASKSGAHSDGIRWVHNQMEFAGTPPEYGIYKHLASKLGAHSDEIRWDSTRIWDL
ncbi:homocitrate synthase [Striga asiatica]|uniref:Homocitrate synthase n=1 Tax=Striga asiatica TaxID=4170 RepID=A0A5A7Q9Q5_STRAF|nr:homocitrate synthase [Striga asiatica]